MQKQFWRFISRLAVTTHDDGRTLAAAALSVAVRGVLGAEADLVGEVRVLVSLLFEGQRSAGHLVERLLHVGRVAGACLERRHVALRRAPLRRLPCRHLTFTRALPVLIIQVKILIQVK